jgi:protein-tyrosine-phosphatase
VTQKPRVLFLCTHNAARSQIAEVLLRQYAGHRFEVIRAGFEPTEVRVPQGGTGDRARDGGGSSV